MSLVATISQVESARDSIYVMHGTCEKYRAFHQHSKSQLTYMEGGPGYINLGGNFFVIPARHYVWIPAGVKHSMMIGHSAAICRTLYFSSNNDLKNEFYTKFGIYPINDLLDQMIRYSRQWHGHIFPRDIGYGFLQSIKDILPQVSNQILSVSIPYTENSKMLKIITYMQDNLSENLTMLSIGARFGLSKRSLSRFFRSILKVSFLQYLKLLRMAKAFDLIAANEYPLADVAYLCGYQSLSSFSNAFYQTTNIRPSRLFISALPELSPKSQ